MKKFRYRSVFAALVISAMILFSGVFPVSMLFQAVQASTVLTNRKWVTTNFGNGLWEGGIVIGDVNQSNPGEEVVFATDNNSGTVYCLDGNTGHVLWTYSDSSIYAYAQTQLYDLDGDGNLEVCVPLYYPPGLLVLRSNGTLYWKTYIANGGTTMGSFVAADVDGDGKLEIFHGSQNVEAGTNGIFVGRVTKLSYNGKILAQTFNWRACSGGVSIADTDNDGQFEIYTGDRDMYMNDGDYGKGVRSFWASNLTQRWCHPDILTSSQCPVLADVDGDGVLDVIVSDMSGGVVCLNSTSGSAKSISPNARFRDTGNINVPGHYQETVGDVDGDGHLELVTADGTHSGSYANYSNEVVIYDLYTGQVEARLNLGLCKYAPTLANLTGGSTLDIIACNMTSIFIFRYDSSTKTYTKLDEVDNLMYGLMYGIVQDIDNDGKLEVVVGRASGTSSYIYAFDTNTPKPTQRIRSDVRWYSEYRRGVAEYIAPPVYGQNHAAIQVDSAATELVQDVSSSFGNLTVGSTYSNVAQYWYGSRYQISENGTASSISLYVSERNGENRPLKVAIYDDNSGTPLNLLAQGTSTIPANFTGWLNVALSSSPDLFAGDYYWLTANAIASGKNVRFYYSAGTTHQGVYGTTSFASFPLNTCVYSSLNNRAYNIYCNYTPKGFWVTSHAPDGSTVDVGTTISVNFSSPAEHSSVEAAFSVNPVVSGTFSWSPDDIAMTFTPNSNLSYATLYTVTLTTAAQSQLSENLSAPVSWSFTTGISLGTISSSFGNLTVGSTYSNVAQYWYGSRYQISENGTASSISLYVSERNGENRPLKVAIYQDSSGVPTTLLAQGVSTIPASFTGWFTVSLSSFPHLSANNYYWLTANAINSTKNVRFYYSAGTTNQGVYGTTSFAGFPLNPCVYSSLNNRAYSIYCNYSSTGASIVSTVPMDGAVNVSVSSTVVVTFNKPMNTTSVQAAFSMTPSTTGSFSWSLGDTVMTFTPTSNLQYNKSYNAAITAVAQSKDGISLTPYPWSFRTVSQPPPIGTWVVQRLANGDLVCTNTTYVDPSISRVFNWYVNDYKNPTVTSPTSLTNVLMTFDTNDGTSPVDYSPYDNNGISYGASWTNTHGGAYYFDGVSDYIQIPDGSPGYFNGSMQPRVGDLISDGNKSEMTLELWIYLSQNENNVRFVSKIPSYEIGLSFSGSNRLFAGVWTQTGTDFTDKGFRGYYSATNSTGISINTWHQVAFTYKDGQGLKLYLDGAMVGSYSGASGNIHCSSDEPLMLGWFDYFHGMISQVRLYPKCLSDAQISQRYVEVNQPNYTQSVIKSSQTRGQETWMCEVITNGQSQMTNNITMPNNAPSATNLDIGPRLTLQPLKTDNLTAIYSYNDPDQNNEIGSQIRWYQNGNLGSNFNDMRTIPSSATTTGDTWYFTVKPFDGNLYGTIATSPTVTIVANNPPTISGTPSLSKDASGNLTCSVTTNDPDGPTPTRKIYNWQVNGASIANLQMPFDTDNMLTGAKDYSPNANNGVISGATWTPNGVVGGALHFDGTDVVTVADNNLGGDAAGTWTQLTIEFWIKLDSAQKGSRIVAKKVGTSSSGEYMVGFQTSDPHSNALFFGVTTPNGFTDTSSAGDYDTVQPGNVLQVGVWYHILCTYQSGPGLTIYVNGTKTVNYPLSGTITTETEFVAGDEPLFIGSDGSAQTNRYVKGTLDELSIYNRCLTPQQAYQCYAESMNGQSDSSTIVTHETLPGQTWICVVTPNDKYQDGPSVKSNSVVT